MQNWINSYLNGPNSSRNLRAVIGFRDTPLTMGSLSYVLLSPNPNFISTFMFSLLSLNYLARIRGQEKKKTKYYYNFISIIIVISDKFKKEREREKESKKTPW